MSLDIGVDAETVHRVLHDLHFQDIVIDDGIFKWCETEIEKQDKIRNPDSLSLQVSSMQPFSEVNFTKEVVQNSIFACHLLDQSEVDTAALSFPHSLLEVNKSGPLELDERASSQRKSVDGAESLDTARESKAVAVHQYLIAKGSVKPSGHVVYYIAFSSHRSLKEWNERHTDFEDGTNHT